MEVTEETVFLELNSYRLRDACGRKREWLKFKLVNLENSAFQHNNQITQHSLFIADSIVNNRSCLQLRNFYRQHLPEAKKWQICNKCRNSHFVLHSWWKEIKRVNFPWTMLPLMDLVHVDPGVHTGTWSPPSHHTEKAIRLNPQNIWPSHFHKTKVSK